MLAFDRPSSELDDAYHDSHQPELIYTLPNAIRPVTSGQGAEMSLALYAAPQGAGGGVFQTRLAPSYPSVELDDAQTLVQARPYSCKWKLTPRSQVEHADGFSNWHDGVFDAIRTIQDDESPDVTSFRERLAGNPARASYPDLWGTFA